jgi:hypothetical protein
VHQWIYQKHEAVDEKMNLQALLQPAGISEFINNNPRVNPVLNLNNNKIKTSTSYSKQRNCNHDA